MRAMASLSGFGQRLSQLRQAFAQTRAADNKLVGYMVAAAAGTFSVISGLGVVLDQPIAGPLLGLLLAAMAAMIVLGLRAQRAALGAIEGQPGAAAAVLQSMRGRWKVTPAVGVTRKQDFVHRVVGRPGVVLVGEGASARVTSLLKQEKRRVARTVGDTPVHEVSVGDREGQVPLRQLQNHMAKLPRALKAGDVDTLDRKLRALGHSDLPMPKGPMPRPGRRR